VKTASGKAKYFQSKTPLEYLAQRTMIPFDGHTDCWLWTKGVDKDGYGQCHAAKVAKDNKVTRAHQLAWVMMNGSIPEGMLVCHTCDNPTCVNPKHLFLGTNRDNVHDMINKGRVRYRKENPNTEAIVKLHGVKSCSEVAKEFSCSFSLVCQIWRKAGLYGRNH
jgi:hypothetical protein